MKKHPLSFRQPDIPRTGVNSPVTTYKLTPEEIQDRYGHIQPYAKQRDLEITAPHTRSVMFKTGGLH